MTLNASDLPRGMRSKTLAGDRIAWYWQPTPDDIRRGFTPKSAALGPDFARACKVAETLNADLDNWRNGVDRPKYEPGTVNWMIAEFEASRAYRNLSASSKRNYSLQLGRIAKLQLKSPAGPFGALELTRINTRTADTIYEKMAKRGSRTGAYAMAAMRRAWNVVWRLWPELVPSVNPFEKMGISHAAEETKPATYGQLLTFVSMAVAEGELGVAIAARAAWDLCMRPSEIYEKFAHAHWRPEDYPHHCWVGSAKNDHGARVFVADPDTGEAFYPELDKLIDTAGPKGSLVVLRRQQKGPKVYRDWIPITPRLGASLALKIRRKAKLPNYVTIEAFRHGGLTELGEGGLSDSLAQAVSRHKKRETLSRYIHRTDTLSLEAARQRAAHRRGK